MFLFEYHTMVLYLFCDRLPSGHARNGFESARRLRFPLHFVRSTEWKARFLQC